MDPAVFTKLMAIYSLLPGLSFPCRRFRLHSIYASRDQFHWMGERMELGKFQLYSFGEGKFFLANT